MSVRIRAQAAQSKAINVAPGDLDSTGTERPVWLPDDLTTSVPVWCSGLIVSCGDEPLPNHEATSHAQATVDAIRMIPPGAKLSKFLPGYGSNYRRLAPDRPSWTVTATCYTDLIHPCEDRVLTVRELARLQTFPDHWQFMGPRRGGVGKRLVAHVFAQIGNAVPPLLAYSVAKHLKSTLFGSKKVISAVSLFSGAGGMDVGFEAAGYSIRACVEKDRYAAATLRANRVSGRKGRRHGFLREAVILSDDIFDLSSRRLQRAARLDQGTVDILIGGPPCQSFSHAGTREGRADHRGMLVSEFLRFVKDLSPQCVVFENVPGLNSADDGNVLKYLLSNLEDCGFVNEVMVLNAADYGVPQIRKRLFVIAHREVALVGRPRETHAPVAGSLFAASVQPHQTVREALAGLPPAAPPGRVANAIAGTIANRKSRQDFSKFAKRTMDLPPLVTAALAPYEALLLMKGDQDPSIFETILLYVLDTRRKVELNARSALRLFVDTFGLELPEKAYDAVYILGAKALMRREVIGPIDDAGDVLSLRRSVRVRACSGARGEERRS